MSHDDVYTAITFAPVQGFIESSRKLRDLYGSSYLLSFLSNAICLTVPQNSVISPASPNIIQGMPNVLLIQDYLSEKLARDCFQAVWSCIVKTCQSWIEKEVQSDDWTYCWNRSWQAWCEHTWEFFYADHHTFSSHSSGEAVQAVRRKLNEAKHSRAWTGINWGGESSTLTGTDAIAYPEMACVHSPTYPKDRYEGVLKDFYGRLRYSLGNRFIQNTPELRSKTNGLSEVKYRDRCIDYGNAFIDEREELSIPDLIKRLFTHRDVVLSLQENLPKALSHLHQPELRVKEFTQLVDDLATQIEKDLSHENFKDLNRCSQRNQANHQTPKPVFWTGWFMGDGDNAGKLLQSYTNASDITQFSYQMREWGHQLKAEQEKHLNSLGRIIYAGGDDFMGVLYDPNQQLEPSRCIEWLTQFKPTLWEGINGAKPITPSIGFIWVSPQVPQRDLLQHCRSAEKAAKKAGRDRLAIRIVFSNGNTIEWICPWRFLPVLFDYCDRNNNSKFPNWTHLYKDIAVLESRHAFTSDSLNIALGLFKIYFDPEKATHAYWSRDNQTTFYRLMHTDHNKPIIEDENWWNLYGSTTSYDSDQGTLISTGLLGDRKHFTQNRQPDGDLNLPKTHQAINEWVINLAKIGFHLCSPVPPTVQQHSTTQPRLLNSST